MFDVDYTAFWGNFLVGFGGSLVAECFRIRSFIISFYPNKFIFKSIHPLYYILSLIIVLGGGFFTAFLFNKSNDILYLESFVVGVMSKDYIQKWISRTAGKNGKTIDG